MELVLDRVDFHSYYGKRSWILIIDNLDHINGQNLDRLSSKFDAEFLSKNDLSRNEDYGFFLETYRILGLECEQVLEKVDPNTCGGYNAMQLLLE